MTPETIVPPAHRDPLLWLAGVMAVLVRLVPLVQFGSSNCTRDECTYRVLAQRILHGDGLVAPDGGWLWAPGYPYLLALSDWLWGTDQAVKWLQLWAAVISVGLAFRVARRLIDDPERARRAGLLAAFAMALHPTMAYFTATLWSEVLYGALLLGAVEAALWSRDGRSWRALLAGGLVGVCVLFRGVATYMLPIFAIAAVWPDPTESLREAIRKRWTHALAATLAAVLVVAPYSVTASAKHGGLVISDATLGQMMWLGCNDFPPVTFDYANGLYTSRAYDAWTRPGRPHCGDDLSAAAWNACETRNGVAWITAHPQEQVRRVPLRLAQLFDPNTFFTRHLRWGKWFGLSFELKEALVALIAATSITVVLGGSFAGALRAKGPYGVLAAGIVGYHVLAIAMLAGLSRYRLPLEPFGMIFLAVALADWPRTKEALVPGPRLVVGMTLVAGLLPLVLWFLPDGWPILH